MLNESEAFSQDIRATQPPDSLGDLPLIVLTHGKPPVEMLETMSPGITLEYLTEARIVWNELQTELAALSTRGNQIIATESGHSIHADQPELLVDSVKELVQLVRQEQ